jgi:hypothetical protein
MEIGIEGIGMLKSESEKIIEKSEMDFKEK